MLKRKTKKRHRLKLSPRVAKLIKILQRNPNLTLTEAGKRAGYKGRCLAQTASASLRRARARSIIIQEMDSRPKLQTPALLKKLEEGLDAKKTEFFAHKGVVKEKVHCVDFPTRKGYLELAGRWKKLEVPEEVETNRIMVTLTDAQLARIAARKASPKDFIDG